jgi:NAD(P)-dependent dehydrogenase (short-subunit alcohol dehydrogenase family)
MPGRLSGKVCVITGTGGSMGRETALAGREHGIRANSISPGLIESNATREQLNDLPHTFVASPPASASSIKTPHASI